jgi:hypothetical protein
VYAYTNKALELNMTIQWGSQIEVTYLGFLIARLTGIMGISTPADHCIPSSSAPLRNFKEVQTHGPLFIPRAVNAITTRSRPR